MRTQRITTRCTRAGLRPMLGATVLAIAGCMVGPNYTPPATTMSAAYREPQSAGASTQPADAANAAAADAGDVRWWRRFNDPQLADLVEKSVKANYSVALAQARVREARQSRHIAQSLLWPTVNFNASVLRYRISDNVISFPGMGQEDSLFSVGFDAAWVMDVFGGTRRGIESARAMEEATKAERRGVVLLVASETARAYLELRGTQKELEIAESTLADQRQTLAVTEDRRRNGLASDLEVLRARTEVESTAAEVPPLQQAIRQYIHVLSTLLGEQPTALSEALTPVAPIPSPESQVAVGVPSDLLRRRPDIQSAERQLAAATSDVGVATAQLFPKVVLGGVAGFQSRDFDQWFNGGSGTYATGPFINWTVFDAGRRKAGVKLAEARVDAAKANYQDTVLRAFREVESSWVAVDRSVEQVQDLERLSASARQSAEIARRDYQRGILDQLTVLDAQRQSNRADLQLAQGRVQLVVYTVALYKALGGGWEVAEPSSNKAVPATQPSTEHHEGNVP